MNKKNHCEHHNKESKWSQNKDSFDWNKCKETYIEFYENVNKNQDVVTMLKECHNNDKKNTQEFKHKNQSAIVGETTLQKGEHESIKV